MGSDCDGVETLLKAGALPNDTGSPDDFIGEQGTIMHRLKHLHGASPLKICKGFEMVFPHARQVTKDDRKKIEEFLLHYRAEELSTTCELNMQERRSIARG